MHWKSLPPTLFFYINFQKQNSCGLKLSWIVTDTFLSECVPELEF